MSVRVYSVFMLSYVGSSLVKRPISRRRSPTSCLWNPLFQFNSDGEQVIRPA
jgi:hypothetical protein